MVSMAVGFAVAAVITRDGRLDDARAVGVVAGRQHEHRMAGVMLMRNVGQPGGLLLPESASNNLSDERTQFRLVHSCTSTESMMPTIAASTGAPLRPRASPAARP